MLGCQLCPNAASHVECLRHVAHQRAYFPSQWRRPAQAPAHVANPLGCTLHGLSGDPVESAAPLRTFHLAEGAERLALPAERVAEQPPGQADCQAPASSRAGKESDAVAGSEPVEGRQAGRQASGLPLAAQTGATPATSTRGRQAGASKAAAGPAGSSPSAARGRTRLLREGRRAPPRQGRHGTAAGFRGRVLKAPPRAWGGGGKRAVPSAGGAEAGAGRQAGASAASRAAQEEIKDGRGGSARPGPDALRARCGPSDARDPRRTSRPARSMGLAGATGLWRARMLRLLLPLLGHVVSSKDIQPNCCTDLATMLVCHWDVDSFTNCTTEYRIRYSTDVLPLSLECIPENESGPGAASRCTCIIVGEVFESTTYKLVLERIQIRNRTEIRNRTVMWNKTVEADDIVKPRPLVNLTVEKKKERRSFILTWKRDYKQVSKLSGVEAKHEVAYWPKDQRNEKMTYSTSQSSYNIFADRLKPGASYVARVRYQLRNWGPKWSEWSVPCEWHNDFEPEPGDELWKSISWLWVPIVALILTCYLCFVRVKREWWDQIPSPAKSKMVEMTATTRVFSVVQKDDGKTVFHDRRKLESRSKLYVPPSGQSTREKDPGNNFGGKPEVFLTPEVALVESPLVICSSRSHVTPRTSDGEEANPIPHEDAVASLFGDLLSGDWSPGDPGIQGPPAKEEAPEHILAALCFPPEASLDKHNCRVASGDLEACSGPGYQSSSTERAASPQPVCRMPEQQPGPSLSSSGAQPRLLPQKSINTPTGTGILGSIPPLAEGQDGSDSIATSHPSGYKCFSSLVSQPVTSFSPVWKPWPFAPQVDERPCLDPRFSGLQPDFPGAQGSTAALVLSSEREASPEETSQDVPGKPGHIPCPAVSLLSGYRSFNSALQNSTASQDPCSLDLESAYKPLLSVLRNSPTETPEGKTPTWL
ncbi:interleukin-4 receptor subunit alpha [Elgaria multicarinata webbii]|uniref:interleukin-4 receptor subunit alpha n=1 Tax=Elgaria multicarinata webbii TaxID=159646 RepID=UPI002FCCE17C